MSALPISFTEVKTINGIVTTHNKLIIAVSDMDSATSPFANEVRIFEVTPPGSAAMIITPIANSGERGHIMISRNAITGSKMIWLIAPTMKSLGCLTTLAKSSLVRPRPKANIMKAKASGKNTSTIIPIMVKCTLYWANGQGK